MYVIIVALLLIIVVVAVFIGLRYYFTQRSVTLLLALQLNF